MALGHRAPVPGLCHHSDRGSQYASGNYRDALRENNIICSMSRKGNCWDNAVTVSFFATLKKDLIYRRPWASVSGVRTAIVETIEVYYNRKRKHSSLGYHSPATFERNYEKGTARISLAV